LICEQFSIYRVIEASQSQATTQRQNRSILEGQALKLSEGEWVVYNIESDNSVAYVIYY